MTVSLDFKACEVLGLDVDLHAFFSLPKGRANLLLRSIYRRINNPTFGSLANFLISAKCLLKLYSTTLVEQFPILIQITFGG